MARTKQTQKRRQSSYDLTPFTDTFILSHQSEGTKPRTLEHYELTLKRFRWWLEKFEYPTDVREVEELHIRKFILYLQSPNAERWDLSDTKPLLAPGTVHYFARALRAFFRWLEKNYGIDNPMANVKMPKLPNAWKVEILNEREISALFRAIASGDTPFLIARNRCILALLLDTGLRASELLSLTVADINPRLWSFGVTGKGEKYRRVTVGVTARKEVLDWLRHRSTVESTTMALFITEHGTALTYHGLSEMFRNLKDTTGIKHARPHVCRHTFATRAANNGMPAHILQDVLGHADYDTTRRFYLHTSDEDIETAHQSYGPLDRIAKSIKAPNQPAQARKRAELPPAEQLAEEVQTTSYLAVAARYNVSDWCIRKRLRKAGLEVRTLKGR